MLKKLYTYTIDKTSVSSRRMTTRRPRCIHAYRGTSCCATWYKTSFRTLVLWRSTVNHRNPPHQCWTKANEAQVRLSFAMWSLICYCVVIEYLIAWINYCFKLCAQIYVCNKFITCSLENIQIIIYKFANFMYFRIFFCGNRNLEKKTIEKIVYRYILDHFHGIFVGVTLVNFLCFKLYTNKRYEWIFISACAWNHARV